MYLIKKISIVILIFFLFNNFAPSQVKIKFSDNCLTKLVIEERNLTNYLMKYNVSVKSVDLKNNYSYSYNESKIYYAASTIKMLSAIYFYDRAMKKEIDLDTTMKYEVKYKKNASKGMDKEKINTEISLRNLIKYSIMVSDNTAYAMLIDYIGKNKLQEYGFSLGATKTLNLQDNYGSINTWDAIVYLQRLYQLIIQDNELAKELRYIFINSEENFLKINDFDSLAKYGYYGNNFHIIGIVLTHNPYLISILTLHGGDDYKYIIEDINKKIYNLNQIKSNCK